MFSSASPREALLACPPSPPWNLPSFTVETTLFSPCSRSDTTLSHKNATLAHLDSFSPYDLVLLTDGSVPFPFGKNGSGVHANCSLCGTVATVSFPAGPVCSSFSAEACAILHALCWSRQHQQVFLLFSYLTLALSSPLSFLLLRSLWQIWQELFSLSSCSVRLHWVPGHSFLPGNDAVDMLPRSGALLVPPPIPCSLSPLIYRIHSCLFSDRRCTVSSKFFHTQVSLVSTEGTCVPSSRSLCSLSSLLQRTQPTAKLLSL